MGHQRRVEPGVVGMEPVRQLLDIRLTGDAERVRFSHAEAIKEQQGLPRPAVVIRNLVIPGTSVNNGVMVAHKLGRAPQLVWVSVPRVAPADLATLTAGMIVDAGDTTFAGLPLDRTKVIQLGAFGFTVSIIVDVAVM